MTSDQITARIGDGDDVDLATQPIRPESSLGELVSEMTSEVSTLLRQEIELAKTEAKEEGKRAAKASAMFGIAGIGGLLALILLSFALAWLLENWMDASLAFAIVGIIWAVVAAIALSNGRARLKQIEPLPETKQSIKEDVAWAKAQRT